MALTISEEESGIEKVFGVGIDMEQDAIACRCARFLTSREPLVDKFFPMRLNPFSPKRHHRSPEPHPPPRDPVGGALRGPLLIACYGSAIWPAVCCAKAPKHERDFPLCKTRPEDITADLP